MLLCRGAPCCYKQGGRHHAHFEKCGGSAHDCLSLCIIINIAEDDGMRRALLSSLSGEKILKNDKCVANLYFKLAIWGILGKKPLIILSSWLINICLHCSHFA